MPFNGAGTFTTVNTFVPNTTISSAAVNTNFSDVATGLSDCLTRDGQAGMTAPLKAASGSSGVPSITFTSDTTTGFRLSSGRVVLVQSGADVGALAATPIGTVVDYAGSSAPSGWLLCFGQAVSRTTYALLFSAIGTSWGPGDGVNTFNVPDLRGRATFGADNMGGTPANRLPGGTLTSTGGQRDVTIAQANLPSATLTTTVNDPGHTHSFGTPQQAQSGFQPGSGLTAWTPVAGGTQQSINGNTTGITASTQLGGSGTALTVLNPAAVTNKIIFSGV